MLKTIDHHSFAVAIQRSSKNMTDVSSANLATQLIASLDASLEEAVKAWISGDEVPNVSFGKYSLTKILDIRNHNNYLEAFRLLTDYINDPVAGEKSIWTPARDLYRKEGT